MRWFWKTHTGPVFLIVWCARFKITSSRWCGAEHYDDNPRSITKRILASMMRVYESKKCGWGTLLKICLRYNLVRWFSLCHVYFKIISHECMSHHMLQQSTHTIPNSAFRDDAPVAIINLSYTMDVPRSSVSRLEVVSISSTVVPSISPWSNRGGRYLHNKYCYFSFITSK